MANKPKILSRKWFNSAISLDSLVDGKLNNKVNMSPNPNGENTDPVGDKEVKILTNKFKLATIKALVFAGNAVFSELLGIGGTSIVVPELGQLIMANPQGLLVGPVIVFSASFFAKLKLEMGINGD